MLREDNKGIERDAGIGDVLFYSGHIAPAPLMPGVMHTNKIR